MEGAMESVKVRKKTSGPKHRREKIRQARPRRGRAAVVKRLGHFIARPARSQAPKASAKQEGAKS